jgi:hypothetical protein
MTKDVHKDVHGDTAIGHLNTILAVFITQSVGSMWCAYIFALLALISLPAALASGNVIIIVSWVAQTFLQLVLLPIIIVGQNVQAAANDKRAEVDHIRLQEVHDHLDDLHREVMSHVTTSLDRIEKSVVDHLEKIQDEDHTHISDTHDAVMKSIAAHKEELADMRQMIDMLQKGKPS